MIVSARAPALSAVWLTACEPEGSKQQSSSLASEGRCDLLRGAECISVCVRDCSVHTLQTSRSWACWQRRCDEAPRRAGSAEVRRLRPGDDGEARLVQVRPPRPRGSIALRRRLWGLRRARARPTGLHGTAQRAHADVSVGVAPTRASPHADAVAAAAAPTSEGRRRRRPHRHWTTWDRCSA